MSQDTAGEPSSPLPDKGDAESSGTYLPGSAIARGLLGNFELSNDCQALPFETSNTAEFRATAPDEQLPTGSVLPIGAPASGEDFTRLAATMVKNRMNLWVKRERDRQLRLNMVHDNSHQAADEETHYVRERIKPRLSVRVGRTDSTCQEAHGEEEIHTGRGMVALYERNKLRSRASNEETNTKKGRTKKEPLPVRASHGDSKYLREANQCGSKYLREADRVVARHADEVIRTGRPRKGLGLLTRNRWETMREIAGSSTEDESYIRHARKICRGDPRTRLKTSRLESGSSSDAELYVRREKRNRAKSQSPKTKQRKRKRDDATTTSEESESDMPSRRSRNTRGKRISKGGSREDGYLAETVRQMQERLPHSPCGQRRGLLGVQDTVPGACSRLTVFIYT